MKTNLIRNIFVLALILVTAFGCSKFDDGPWISFRSAENRIEGGWEVQKFYKNSEDLSEFYINNYNWTFYFGSADPEDPSQPGCMCSQIRRGCVYDSLDTIVVSNYFSFWSFYGEDSLCMPILSWPGEQPPYCGLFPLYPGVSKFKILKLTNNKMWLEYTDGDDVHAIKLTKNE